MAKNKVRLPLFSNCFSMNILELINNVHDPQMEGKVVHKLSSIIFVGLCAVLSGYESWS